MAHVTLKPVAVPLLGQAAQEGPYTAELREDVGGGMSCLAWACTHAHRTRAEAEACAIIERGKRV